MKKKITVKLIKKADMKKIVAAKKTVAAKKKSK